MMTRYESVSFVNANVAKMTKEDFIAAHENVFWLDKKPDTRRKMLSEVYDMIVPPPPKRAAKSVK